MYVSFKCMYFINYYIKKKIMFILVLCLQYDDVVFNSLDRYCRQASRVLVLKGNKQI